MARVSINILGISELKWTGISEFNSGDHSIYCCGQESLRRNRVTIIVNKSLKCSGCLQTQKQQNDLCSFPRQTVQYHSNPSLCPDQECWRGWSWTVLWRPSGANTPKRCPFHHRGLDCESGNSRDTWSNRQIFLWSTKWNSSKMNKVLPRQHTGHSKHPLPTTQGKTLHMNITRWSNKIRLTIFFTAKDRKALYIQKTLWLTCDCGSHHQLFIIEFRLKWKKIGTTTRPFRYDLNQIPYDYKVEVTNRLKRLDLIQCTWRTMDRGWWYSTGGSDQAHPQDKEIQKWLSEEALQIAEKRREDKGKAEKERYTHLSAEFQRRARRDKKAFLSDQFKEIEENNRMGKTRDLFKKIRDIPREHFRQRWVRYRTEIVWT